MNFLNPFRTESEVREPGGGANPNFVLDPIDRLPPAAADKLRAIRRAASDAHATMRSLIEEIDELREKKQRRELWLRDYINGRGGNQRHAEDDLTALHERAAIDKIAADLARTQTAYDLRAEKWRALASVAGAVDDYVKVLRSPVETAPPVAPTLAKNETHQQAVERVRKQITKLHEDMQSVLDAPVHSSVAKTMARAKIEALAERGRPNVLVSIEGGRPFEFASVVVNSRSGPGERIVDAAALVAWLHKDSLIARVEAEIDDNADDASALSDEQRQKKRGQIAAAILHAERDEESLIETAADQGVVIARRPDADPRAVLGLADAAPAPRN